MDYRTTINLPGEWGDELKLAAEETAVPAAVLVRQWIVEKLRDLRRERELREQHRPHDWA